MASQNPDRWEQLSQARSALDEQLQDSAEVNYVDIGYVQVDGADDGLALRVHVGGCDNDNTFPNEVDGFSVTVIRCDGNT